MADDDNDQEEENAAQPVAGLPNPQEVKDKADREAAIALAKSRKDALDLKDPKIHYETVKKEVDTKKAILASSRGELKIAKKKLKILKRVLKGEDLETILKEDDDKGGQGSEQSLSVKKVVVKLSEAEKKAFIELVQQYIAAGQLADLQKILSGDIKGLKDKVTNDLQQLAFPERALKEAGKKYNPLEDLIMNVLSKHKKVDFTQKKKLGKMLGRKQGPWQISAEDEYKALLEMIAKMIGEKGKLEKKNSLKGILFGKSLSSKEEKELKEKMEAFAKMLVDAAIAAYIAAANGNPPVYLNLKVNGFKYPPGLREMLQKMLAAQLIIAEQEIRAEKGTLEGRAAPAPVVAASAEVQALQTNVDRISEQLRQTKDVKAGYDQAAVVQERTIDKQVEIKEKIEQEREATAKKQVEEMTKLAEKGAALKQAEINSAVGKAALKTQHEKVVKLEQSIASAKSVLATSVGSMKEALSTKIVESEKELKEELARREHKLTDAIDLLKLQLDVAIQRREAELNEPIVRAKDELSRETKRFNRKKENFLKKTSVAMYDQKPNLVVKDRVYLVKEGDNYAAHYCDAKGKWQDTKISADEMKKLKINFADKESLGKNEVEKIKQLLVAKEQEQLNAQQENIRQLEEERNAVLNTLKDEQSLQVGQLKEEESAKNNVFKEEKNREIKQLKEAGNNDISQFKEQQNKVIAGLEQDLRNEKSIEKELKTSLDNLQKEENLARNQCSIAEKQLGVTTERVSVLDVQARSQAEELANAQKELERIKEYQAEYTSKVSDLENELNNAQQELADQQAQELKERQEREALAQQAAAQPGLVGTPAAVAPTPAPPPGPPVGATLPPTPSGLGSTPAVLTSGDSDPKKEVHGGSPILTAKDAKDAKDAKERAEAEAARVAAEEERQKAKAPDTSSAVTLKANPPR